MMSKSAIILLLFSISLVLWQQSNAKPFFLLPTNFFVLKTKAPSSESTSSSSSSSYTSTSSISSSGSFQLPFQDVSAKLGLITNLLFAFKGGSFQSAPTTTTTTTSSPIEINTVFTPSETTTRKHKHSKHSKTTITPAVITEATSEESDLESPDTTVDYEASIQIKGEGELSEQTKQVKVGVSVSALDDGEKGVDSGNEILSADINRIYLPPL